MGNFNILPKEIILEILMRLPAESVLDCRLVCRPWRDVVHHPSFSRLHLNRLHHDDSENMLSFRNLKGSTGCSPLTNEYKVVRIYASGGDSNVGIIQVYTLGSGSGWRSAGTMDINMKYVDISNGVFANGVLHWVDKQGTIILAFHLADEKFSKFSSPPPCSTRADDPYLVVKLGILGVFVSVTCYYEAGGCDIWLLNKNKDNHEFSWRKEFSFNSYRQQQLDFTKSGRLLCYWKSRIYSYDKKTSFAKMDGDFGKSISQAVQHKNTFVSLKALGEKDTKTMESGERASSGKRQKT